MRFLDTNVFLRYLTRDDERKSRACLVLFEQMRDGIELATTSETVLAEVAYVLSGRGQYRLPHAEISEYLRPLLELSGMRLADVGVYQRALDLYAERTYLDLEDALSVAHMERAGMTEIVSYDRDFDRIPGVTRVEP